MPYDKFTELLRPSRNANAFTTSWRVLHAGSDTPWDNTDCVWFLNGQQYESHYGQTGSMTSDTLNIVNRNAWYPHTSKKLSSVQARIRGTMDNGHWGDFIPSPTLNMQPPLSPEVTVTVGMGSSVEEVKVEASCPSDTSERERAYTVLTVTKRTSAGGNTTLLNRTFTDLSTSWSANVSDVESGLTQNGWIEVTATARSLGYAGDSSTVSKSHVFAWPGNPQITKVSTSGTVSNSGMVLVSCKTNQSKYHPTDSVQLQMLKPESASAANNVDTAAAAAPANGWADVTNAVDDGDCTGLTMPLVNAYPVQGTHVWYRLVATHGSHTLVSLPVALPIFDPIPTAGKAHIWGLASGDDGKSLVVDVAWKQESAATGVVRATQVAWSADEHAWESSTQPTLYEFDWSDASPRWTNSGMYDKTARVYISGLDEGTRYYVRARRVQTLNGTTTYGEWSGAVFATPASKPAWVDLLAPAAVARGEGLPLSWTFGSDAPQRGWSLTDSTGRVWGDGDDADGAFTIQAAALEGVSTLTLKVSVSTGGEWETSPAKTVAIADRPEITAEVDASIDAQPVVVALTADKPNLDVTLSVTADGVAYERPDGTKTQHGGDVVWASLLTPDWEWDSTDEQYEASVTLPNIALVNGAGYTLVVTGTDPSTGLASETATDAFAVAWSHLATAPTCSVAADSSTLYCKITPTAPSGAALTDVCDIYRLTVDGARLIASDVAFGMEVTDRFAPYSRDGSTGYRVATRTADGDVSWLDYADALNSGVVRLDWEGKSLEFPYNLGVEESIEKSHEERKHLDGTVEGYFEEGVKRVVTITADMKRVAASERELLEEVASYAGAVFVRTPSGLAFDAAVDVTPITESARSAAVGVTLKATEVALTDAHRCGPGDIDDPTTTTTTTTGA